MTGAGAGIGAACARALAAAGAAVAVADIDRATADSVTAAITGAGGQALAVHLDVADEASCRRCVDTVAGAFGGLDILVNNAGIQRYGDVVETTPELWHEVLGVNLTGVFLMSHLAAPHLLGAPAATVVNIASVQSFRSQRRVAAYAASKGGVLQLTRSMAIDLGPRVRVNAVCPGSVDTPMLRWAAGVHGVDPDVAVSEWGASTPLQRVATAEEVAETVLFLAGPRSGCTTGAAHVIDGGLTVGLP